MLAVGVRAEAVKKSLKPCLGSGKESEIISIKKVGDTTRAS
jgi:hypothetical protein